MARSLCFPLSRRCRTGSALLAGGLLLAQGALAVASADAGTVAAAAEASDRRDGAAAIWPVALANNNPDELVLAVRALGRLGGDSVVPALLPLLQHPAASVRAETAFALAIAGAEADAVQQEVEQGLLSQLSKEGELNVRVTLLRALGNCGSEATQLLLRDYWRAGAKPVTEPVAEQAAWAQATGLLWSYRRAALTAIDPALVKQLIVASSKAEPVGEMAAFALARGRKEPAVQAQAKALQQAFATSQSAGARIFLLRALSQTVTEQNSKRWLQAQQRNRVGGRTLNANERIELQTLLAGQLQGPALREAVARALRSAASAERVAVLQTLLNRPAELEPLRDLLQSQQQLQPTDSAWLAPLLQPPTGAEAGGNATGSEADSESQEPAAPTLSYAEAERAVGRRFRLHTVRGAIDIVLLPEAVYTAANFAKLADRGFYNGTVFHRVIGNFVAQGGDPTATGDGGPGWRIREELSQLPHAPGYIGVATSGKDTGGSQFFINTGRNPHLDWHYTVFAKVEAGLDVAMALRQMDTLLAVTPLP